MNITNLETRLAAKIAALDGTEPTEDLLILKKACLDTSVDTTALDAAIQADITALSAASGSEELLIASLAALAPSFSSVIKSIQRGVLSGGSGTTMVISEVDRSKSMVSMTGQKSSGSNRYFEDVGYVTLESSTNVRLWGGTGSQVGWEVIEFV